MDLLAALLHEMRRQHARAREALGRGTHCERVFLMGNNTELLRKLIPEYATAEVRALEEGALRGVARLFDG